MDRVALVVGYLTIGGIAVSAAWCLLVEGARWLRGYLAGILTKLIEGLTVSLTDASRRLPRIPDGEALRDLVARARAGELMRLTLGEDRWRLVEQLQSAMSLIEGHAEHTMDVVGAEVLPSLPRLRKAMTTLDDFRNAGVDPLAHKVVVVKLGYLMPQLRDAAPRDGA